MPHWHRLTVDVQIFHRLENLINPVISSLRIFTDISGVSCDLQGPGRDLLDTGGCLLCIGRKGRELGMDQLAGGSYLFTDIVQSIPEFKPVSGDIQLDPPARRL